MAKFCANCGKELDENAALCLNCGVLVGNTNNNQNKEKKKGLPTWGIVLIIVSSVILLPIIALITFFVFTYNTISNIIDTPDMDLVIDPEVEIRVGTIGDTLESDDIKLTLTEVLTSSSIGDDKYIIESPENGKEYLIFFFDVENITNTSKSISFTNFSGYSDGFKISNKVILNDINDIRYFDSMIFPYEEDKGYVAFEINKNWKKFEIRYTGLFDYKELVFRVTNEDNLNIQGA